MEAKVKNLNEYLKYHNVGFFFFLLLYLVTWNRDKVLNVVHLSRFYYPWVQALF